MRCNRTPNPEHRTSNLEPTPFSRILQLNMEFSFWERDSVVGKTDTIVVGAGIVGLSAALRRKAQDPDEAVVVLDASPICGGGSSRNAGFACFGSPSELLSDLKSMPRAEVIQLIRQRWEGLQRLRRLLGDREIDYRATGGIELFRTEEQALERQCLDALKSLNDLMDEAIGERPFEQLSQQQLTGYNFEGFTTAINNTLEGSIDTGKMFHSLCAKAQDEGVRIFNGLQVNALHPESGFVSVETSYGTLRADRVLICTNGFSQKLLPLAPVKPARNLVLMTEPIETLNWQGTFHMQEGYVYFRNVGKRILIGGARHLDEHWSETDEQIPAAVHNHLTELLNRHILPFRAAKIEYQWIGYLGVGETKKVIVEKVHDRMACGVRLGGMGVAIGTAIGAAVADLIE
jgi:hypothetical protein